MNVISNVTINVSENLMKVHNFFFKFWIKVFGLKKNKQLSIGLIERKKTECNPFKHFYSFFLYNFFLIRSNEYFRKIKLKNTFLLVSLDFFK
jgi:hypothetical protein